MPGLVACDGCPRCGHSFAVGRAVLVCECCARVEMVDDLAKLPDLCPIVCPGCGSILVSLDGAFVRTLEPLELFVFALRLDERVIAAYESIQSGYRDLRYRRSRDEARRRRAREEAEAECRQGEGRAAEWEC